MNSFTSQIFAALLLINAVFCLSSCDKQLKCSTPEGLVKVILKKTGKNHYILTSVLNGKQNSWNLPYPVYNFETGDIDGNHSDDILVGVIKTTRFDSHYRKRIFMFKLVDGCIRPLWLGSRVSQPLEMFNLHHSDSFSTILTIEQEKDGKFLVAQYRWRGFGLEFTKYISREINKKQAYKLIYHYEKE